MKYLGILIGIFASTSIASAKAMPPIGHFVCPIKNGDFSFTISTPMADTYLLKVVHHLNGDETLLQGFGVIGSFERSTAKGSFQVIRLPSTTFEAYYDDQGNIGFDPSVLNCQKM